MQSFASFLKKFVKNKTSECSEVFVVLISYFLPYRDSITLS